MKRGPSKVSAKDAFRTAEAWLEASEVLHTDGRAGNDRLLVFVFATMSAFQLEMYLKALLLLEDGLHTEGHNVLKLFQKLSVKTQAELTKEHAAYIARFPEVATRLKEKNISPDLLSLLRHGQDAFVVFRYAHERKKDQKSTWALTSLVMAIRDRIRKAKPEWHDILRDTEGHGPLYPARQVGNARADD